MLDYQNLYEYKPPSRDRIPAYAALRVQFRDLDRLINDQLPEGELKEQSRISLYKSYLLADATLKNEIVGENNLFSD